MTPSFPHARLRTFLPPAALGIIAVLLSAVSHAHTTNAIDLFDEAVARGLPQTIVLSHAGADNGKLVVESSLDVEVRFPGDMTGDVPGDMYVATWRGEHAVLTRSGNHLDISVPRSGSVEVTGFSADAEGSHHVDTGVTHDRQELVIPHASVQTMALPRYAARSTMAATPPRKPTLPTLTFWLFLHDDTLDITRQHIHASYVAWWIADMKKILPSRRLWVIYSQQIEGLTDIPYGHKSALQDWSTAMDTYARQQKLPQVHGEFEYKFMLLTKHEVAPGVSGLAWLGGDQAMASLSGRYTIVAHEYGHTLTANHEDAEVRWSSGWPCETNLKSTASPLRANCYRYSAANERRMRAHMANEWTVPVRLRPPDIPRYIVD